MPRVPTRPRQPISPRGNPVTIEHTGDEAPWTPSWKPLTPEQRRVLGVMTELLLRGAQTLGDLRVRAARMEPVPDQAALKPIVDGLVKRGLVIELTGPGRGQVVSHALYGEQELAELRARHAGRASARPSPGDAEPAAAAPGASAARPAPGGTGETLARLAGEIAELRAEVARLSQKIDALESKAG